MAERPDPESTDPADAGDSETRIGALILRVRNKASAFVRAEVQYVLAQLGARASLALPALLMLVIAAALGFATLSALLIGSILALTPILSAWGAMAVVIGCTLLLSYILVRVAISRLNTALQPMEDE